MTKTPEQMAEEYANTTDSCHVDQEYAFAYNGFLAGYQAGKDEILSKGMQSYITEIRNDAWCTAMQLGQQSQWISVKERLPEDGEIALTVCDNGKMFLLQKVSDEMFHVPIYWKYCCGFDKELAPNESYCYDVTHWMPLPTLPKEEK